MKGKINHIVLLGLSLLMSAGLFFRCANVTNPSGGPRDERGPKVLFMFPENERTQFDDDEIHIIFDEYLRSGSYASEVFISPLPTVPPEIFVRNKSLVIRFLSELRENTTYVLTIGTGIKDANEGNKLVSPITYAFSTGDYLDSLEVKGQVIDPITGRGEKDFTVMLFEPDSIPDHDFFQKKPIYAARTDENGNFKLSFLARDEYVIYGVADADQDYQYSQPKEKIAIAENPVVQFADSGATPEIRLFSFLPDLDLPQLKSVKYINDEVLLAEFKEDIQTAWKDSSLKISVKDTLSTEYQSVEHFEMISDIKTDIFIITGKGRTEYLDLKFEGLKDTLGNQLDTVVRIDPEGLNRKYRNMTYLDVKYTSKDNTVRMGTTLPMRPDFPDSLVQLLDTGGVSLPAEVSHSRFLLKVVPQTQPDFTFEYIFKVLRSDIFAPGSTIDTLAGVKILFPNPEGYGSVQGTIKDTLGTHNWILYLKDSKNKVARKSTESSFDFQFLKTGKYNFLLLDDADGNGVWTPGSLSPYALPEKFYADRQAIDVKAKWEIEDFEVVPSPLVAAPDTSKGKKGGGKGTPGGGETGGMKKGK